MNIQISSGGGGVRLECRAPMVSIGHADLPLWPRRSNLRMSIWSIGTCPPVHIHQVGTVGPPTGPRDLGPGMGPPPPHPSYIYLHTQHILKQVQLSVHMWLWQLPPPFLTYIYIPNIS